MVAICHIWLLKSLFIVVNRVVQTGKVQILRCDPFQLLRGHLWLVDTQLNRVNQNISIVVTVVLAALVQIGLHPKDETLEVFSGQKVPARCAGWEGVFCPGLIKSVRGFSSFLPLLPFWNGSRFTYDGRKLIFSDFFFKRHVLDCSDDELSQHLAFSKHCATAVGGVRKLLYFSWNPFIVYIFLRLRQDLGGLFLYS